MKKITIKVEFKSDMNGVEVGKIIQQAIQNQGFVISTFRTTYIVIEDGTEIRFTEMPPSLMLALIIGDGKTGFGWYLPKLSGEYVLEFNSDDEE